jgi:hypothetical protein
MPESLLALGKSLFAILKTLPALLKTLIALLKSPVALLQTFDGLRKKAIENSIWNWNRCRVEPPTGETLDRDMSPLDTQVVWQEYQRLGANRSRQTRFVPHMLVSALFFGMLFAVFGFAVTPIRGRISDWAVFLSFISCGMVILWLMFYVMDAIRLSNRLLVILAAPQTFWPEETIARAANELRVAGNKIDSNVRDLVSRYLEMKLIAQHTDVIARFVYAPSVALVIWFVARLSLFDNWSWSPPIMGAFVVALGLDLYCAWILGVSAMRAKNNSLSAVTQWMNRLPTGDAGRESAERILKEIESLQSVALVPLRNQPVIRAALLPFGSLGTLSLIDALLTYLGQ